MRMKDEDWDTVIKVNLEAHYRLSKAALAGHDETAVRPHYRHHICRGCHRKCRSDQLRSVQGGHDRFHKIVSPRKSLRAA
jgi:NAD(P)-dependent dehydrogenase (short-subunit alcohol dehydrogenase family)